MPLSDRTLLSADDDDVIINSRFILLDRNTTDDRIFFKDLSNDTSDNGL